MNKPKTPITPAALRGQMVDVLDRFRRGEASKADVEEATRALRASSAKMRSEARMLKAMLSLQTADDSRGRPPLPDADVMKPVSIYMKAAQREKLQRLGGAPWVRKKIDQAKE